MTSLPLVLSILFLILCSAPAPAAEIVFSCDVVQDSTGSSTPETVTLDNEKLSIGHLKRIWSEGQPSRFVDSEEEFVRITKDRLTWGSRRRDDGMIGDLFSVDRKTGAYAWLDSSGREIAHGACTVPDLTS